MTENKKKENKKKEMQPWAEIMPQLIGETPKEYVHVDIAGGDKTIIFFESGKVLILPIYRFCPVQPIQTKEAFEREGRKELIDYLSAGLVRITQKVTDDIKTLQEI